MAENNEKQEYLVLIDEDGNEVEFEVLDMFEMNGKNYIVLYPCQEEEEEDVFIFRVVADANGDEQIEAIEDEDELNEAFELFLDRYEDEEEE